MINSKQIKDTNIKAIKFSEASETEDLKPWEKKIQSVAKKLDRIAKKILPRSLFYKIDFLDDFGMFKPKYALECFVDRWVRLITFRQFRYHLKNGIDYFKRGFNSHDFDSVHALDDFLWKLERLEKVIKDNDRHYGADQDSKRIREVIRLMNRVIEDDYMEEFEKTLEEKYGVSIHYYAKPDFFNEGKGPFKNDRVGCISMYKREKETYENYKEIRKAERAKYRKAHNKRMREWKKALNIIENHFFEWWD